MNTLRNRHPRSAFTMIEVVVVLAIMSVLISFVFLETVPARERARQAICLSNLRQIGQAIAMYRQDYGGSDGPGWPSEMGLPPNHSFLLARTRGGVESYLSGGRDVLLCPDDPNRTTAVSSYGWDAWDQDNLSVPWKFRKQLPHIIAKLGGN